MSLRALRIMNSCKRQVTSHKSCCRVNVDAWFKSPPMARTGADAEKSVFTQNNSKRETLPVNIATVEQWNIRLLMILFFLFNRCTSKSRSGHKQMVQANCLYFCSVSELALVMVSICDVVYFYFSFEMILHFIIRYLLPMHIHFMPQHTFYQNMWVCLTAHSLQFISKIAFKMQDL